MIRTKQSMESARKTAGFFIEKLEKDFSDFMATSGKYRFDDFIRLYLNSNQYVRGETEGYVTPQSSILTITGGGDHVIDSIGLGANNISAIDINTGQEFICILKILGVMFLNYEEYLQLFCNGKGLNFLDKNILTYLLERSDNLKNFDISTTKVFWKEMMANIPNLSEIVLCKGVNHLEQYGYISNNIKYNQVKNMLLNFTGTLSFENMDIRNLNSLNYSQELFDVVYLQNLYNFMKKDEYLKLVNDIFSYVKDNGIISTYAFGQKKSWYKTGYFPDMFDERFYKLGVTFNFSNTDEYSSITRDFVWLIKERTKLFELYLEFSKNRDISLVEVPACRGYACLTGPNDMLLMAKKKKR